MEICLHWLDKWEEDANACHDLPKSARNKIMPSDKLQFDIRSTLIGFKEVCKISFEKHPGCHIRPGKTNSDIVENIFARKEAKTGNIIIPLMRSMAQHTDVEGLADDVEGPADVKGVLSV